MEMLPLNPLWKTTGDDWTADDALAAREFGWNIYAGAPSNRDQRDPPFEVWHDKESGFNMDDVDAHESLRELARDGNATALRAKRFLFKHSRIEYFRVFGRR